MATDNIDVTPGSGKTIRSRNQNSKLTQVVMEDSLTWASSNGTAITTATNTSVVAAPSAGNHLQAWRLHASNSSATSVVVSWRDGVGGTLLFETNLPQNGVISMKLNGDWDLTTATAMYINTSAAATVYWTVGYLTVAD